MNKSKLRIAEPLLHATKNIVDVNYDVFIENKKNIEIVEEKRTSQNTILFDTELEIICEKSRI